MLVLCGDVPLLRTATLQSMLEEHHGRRAALTVLTTCLEDPTGYGRILRDGRGARVAGVVEETDATALPEEPARDQQRRLLPARFLFSSTRCPEWGAVTPREEQYLTDVVGLAARDGPVHRRRDHRA